MARPWRIEYEGALYHVFSRGNNQQNIFLTDDDRYLFLDTIGQMSERFDNDIFVYVYGSKKFVKRIKNRYMVSEPDPAIPQQRSIQKSTDPVQFLNKASEVLQCDLGKLKDCARISESDKLNRDILLYWLWQEGKYTNLQIGELFGLTHSSVSRRVTIIRGKWRRAKFSKTD
jgi:hypothetical protein